MGDIPAFWEHEGKKATETLVLYLNALPHEQREAVESVSAKSPLLEMDLRNDSDRKPDLLPNNAVDSAKLPDGQLRALENAATFVADNEGLLGSDEGAKILSRFVKLAGKAASELLASSSSEL